MDPAPPLSQDALDLLAIGRRYYDVVVEWVPKGDPRCYGRAFGFWCVRAGLPGWEAQHRETERLAVPTPAPAGEGLPAGDVPVGKRPRDDQDSTDHGAGAVAGVLPQESCRG